MPVTRHNPGVGHGDDADVVVTPAVAKHNPGVGQRDGKAVARHNPGVGQGDDETSSLPPLLQPTTLVLGNATTRTSSLPPLLQSTTLVLCTTARAPSLPQHVSKKQKKYIN